MWSLKPSYSSNARPPLATVRQARRVSARRGPVARRCLLEALEERTLLSFSPAVSYPAGTAPASVVKADFNGDGRLDLAAGTSGNSVNILLGDGNGTFQNPQSYPSGAPTSSLAVGDFNGDGKPDLATAGQTINTVSILLNNGNGTFATPVNYVGSGGTSSLAVGDFNGDGKPDLATALTYNSVGVLLNNGTGTFRNLAPFVAVSGPTSVAVGDFNADGKLDLVVGGNTDSAIALGNGDGTFKPPVSTGFGADSVAVGDLNGDGKLDLVTASSTYVPGYTDYLTGITYGGGYTGALKVLIGRGDGTFAPRPDETLNGGQPSVAIADFNGDARPDFVLAQQDTNAVTVYMNDGNGGFRAQADTASGVGPAALAVGDFNGDAFPDVAAANPGANGISVLLNTTHWPSLRVGGYPSATTAGETHTVTVTALDNGNLLAGYTGTVHFASSDPQAVLPLDYTFVVADGGTHTFAVTLKTAGPQMIYVWDTVTAGVSGTQSTQVSPAAMSRFGVDGFPTALPIGTLGSLSVTPTDTFGNLVSGYAGTVHFTSTDPAAALPADYTFTPADAYGHTFDATFRTPGLQSITATDKTAPGISGSQGNIEVTGASTFAVFGFPTPIVAGTAAGFTVTALDVYGQVVVGYRGTVHFTSTDPAAALPADYTFTVADQGYHTFAATLRTAGTQSITATSAADTRVTGTQGGIAVNPAIKAITVTGFPSPVTAGVAGNLTVTARDAGGNVAAWYTGTVTFSSNDFQAALPATYTFTAADKGMHTFAATLKTAGTRSITVTDTATGGLSGSEGGITVNPAAASRFLITAPSGVVSGAAFGMTVTVQDAYGNLVTNYTGTIRFQSTDPKATLPVSYTFTAADKGVHTFTGLVLRKRGYQTVTVTDTLRSSITGSAHVNVV